MKRDHREALDPRFAEALLAGSPDSEGITLNVRLRRAVETLRLVVEEADILLAENPLTPIVAAEVARRLHRKGAVRVVVDPDGTAMIEFGTARAGQEKQVYPSLASLRDAAVTLGIDTSKMGRSKTAIIEAIRKVRTQGTPPVVKKTFKTSPALSAPVIIHMPDETEPDVPEPFEPVSVPPVSVTASRKPGGRSLSQIVGSADEEVDLDILFAVPPPAHPPD